MSWEFVEHVPGAEENTGLQLGVAWYNGLIREIFLYVEARECAYNFWYC
jgi:hypothetical protein